jgi:thiamine biosynthesis lipoprotein
MGTDVEILAHPLLSAEAEGRVRTWLTHVESALTRFDPASELSRLNAAAGASFPASKLLYQVLGEALRAAGRSGGLFDPTVLRAVEASGYAISFDQIPDGVREKTAGSSSYRSVRLLPGRQIALAPGTGVDLGGFAKGWAVDRCAHFMDPGTSWLVNAGGDLLAHGPGPEGRGWLAGVEDPLLPGTDMSVLRVDDRAVATSSIMRRRWRTANGDAHHLIDPRTGRPSETDLASVTVIANSVAQAEVEAKVLLLLGREQAVQRAERLGIPALLAGHDGQQAYVGGIGAYLAA